jgi:hypothetical protein
VRAYLAIQQAQTPEAFAGRGVVIPESQVTVALSGQTEIEPHEGYLNHLRYLQERTRLSPEFPLTRLLKKLRATDFQQLVVVLALAAEQNRKYERVFAYLQDNVTERRPTLGLAADLYSLIDRLEEKELFGLYDDRHPLNRFVLMPGRTDRSSASGLSRPLAIRQATLLALTETNTLPEPLPASCTVYRRGAPVTPLTAGGAARAGPPLLRVRPEPAGGRKTGAAADLRCARDRPAICSALSGGDPGHGHPRAGLLGTFRPGLRCPAAARGDRRQLVFSDRRHTRAPEL